jgi:hypothetical protein
MGLDTNSIIEHGQVFTSGAEAAAWLQTRWLNPIPFLRLDQNDDLPTERAHAGPYLRLISDIETQWSESGHLNVSYHDDLIGEELDFWLCSQTSDGTDTMRWFGLTAVLEYLATGRLGRRAGIYLEEFQHYRAVNYRLAQILGAKKTLYFCSDLNQDICDDFWTNGWSIDQWLDTHGHRFDIVHMHEIDKWVWGKYTSTDNNPIPDLPDDTMPNEFGGLVLIDYFHDLRR